MLTLRWIVVLIPAALAVVVGGMAFAWRRAMVRLGRQLFSRFLTPESLATITPPFVAMREGWAVAFLIVATILSFVLLGWQATFGIFVVTYVSMFLSRALYPEPADPYYLRQVISDTQMRLQIANRFNEAALAKRLTSQVEMFEAQLPENLAAAAQKQLFWQRQCAQPLDMSFAEMCLALPAPERKLVEAKSLALAQVCQSVITGSGPARAECDRRRMSALLVANYLEQLRGNFSSSTPKDIETVVTLMASGLAYERLLARSSPAVLTEIFADDERSPLNAA